MASCMDLWKWTRKKAAGINFVVVALGSLPCVLGYNIWASFQPFGAGSTVLDLEDFVVSNLLLPLGSLVYLLFCCSRYGWGFANYRAEANKGKGLKMAGFMRVWLNVGVPILVIFLLVQGIISKI